MQIIFAQFVFSVKNHSDEPKIIVIKITYGPLSIDVSDSLKTIEFLNI